jgi:N-acetyl-anhydromuramyl-L-alanine amidase AmpD
VAYPFVESPNVTPTKGRAIDVVVMHSMEIAERRDAAEICARWFRSSASKVSAHYCVDADGVIQCVRETDIAWHARRGNTSSIGVPCAPRLAGLISRA